MIIACVSKELVEFDMGNFGFHLGLPAPTYRFLYKDQDIATRAGPLLWKTVPNQTIDGQGFPTV